MNPPIETRGIDRLLLGVVLILGGVGLFVGWRLFWFLTDDAFIAFRYVSNSVLGHGYVWNAPPFLPVEGYTSFLWVVLLDGVWRLTGIEPPISANCLSLAFAYGSLVLAIGMIRRIKWTLGRWDTRNLFVTALVLFLVLNRTFLAWSSSGLETSLMTFLLLLWVVVSLSGRTPAQRAGLSALTATALALTRPDGLLYCVATVGVVVSLTLTRSDRRDRIRTLTAGLLPLTVVLAHLAWRHSFYGQWLPNTYYAKVVEPWPESGLRYLLSFVLEYGLWFALAIIGWALVGVFLEWWTTLRGEWNRDRWMAAFLGQVGRVGPCLCVVGAVVLHGAYYTLIVGGDHFEYRVYNHLLPLVFVSLVWALHRMTISVRAAAIVSVTFVLLSLPVQWTHWALTHDLETRRQTHVMRVPIAPSFPKLFRGYARFFDTHQAWLIDHHVCMRHQEHKIYWKTQSREYPTRTRGILVSGDGYPVFGCWHVGVPSWVLPHIAVIDLLGLNDHVIAHTPVTIGGHRNMAHSRRPPEGYAAGFRPNVAIENRQIVVSDRVPPLSREEIIENERLWRMSVDGNRRGGD